jgi:hypothetical protein
MWIQILVSKHYCQVQLPDDIASLSIRLREIDHVANALTIQTPVAYLLYISTLFTEAYNSFRVVQKRLKRLTCLTTKLLTLKTIFHLSVVNLVCFATGSREFNSIEAIQCVPEPDIVVTLSRKLTSVQLGQLQRSLDTCKQNLLRLQDSSTVNLPGIGEDNLINSTNLECLERLKIETENISHLLRDLTSAVHRQDHLSAIPPSSTSTAILAGGKQQRRSIQIEQKLNNYRRVRYLSTGLYHALARACHDHTEHLAHIQLRPHHPTPAGTETCVEFEMRFTSSDQGSSTVSRPQNAVWLSVESSILKRNASNAETHAQQKRDANASSKRLFEGEVFPVERAAKRKYYSGMSEYCHDNLIDSCSSTTPDPDSHAHDANLSARRNFCKIMSRHGQDTIETLPLHLGYIEAHDSHAQEIHRISFSDTFLTLGNSPPVSLVQIMDTLFANRGIDSMLYERVGLAKQLASAMLQFQNTPLLRPGWGGDDIVFFGLLPLQRIGADEILHKPHLNVNIKRSCAAAESCRSNVTPQFRQLSETKGKASVKQGVVSVISLRHSCLLALAVIFIELAYQKPLARCHHMHPCQDDGDGEEAAYYRYRWNVADRLCSGVAARLGLRYRDVVRRCLDLCREPQCSQLADEDFEAIMYTKIIDELEQVKRDMVNDDC